MSSNLSFATYAFPEDDLNGPVVDVNTGQTVYNLSTPKSLLHRSPTEIKSPDGTTLGEVQVNPLFFPGKVSVHGRERKDFMEWAGDGWLVFGNRTYKFQDDEGRSFYWKDYKCFTADGQTVVAEYDRQKKNLFKSNNRAALMVNEAYISILDVVLISALLMELKHKAKERANRGAAMGGGAASAGASG